MHIVGVAGNCCYLFGLFLGEDEFDFSCCLKLSKSTVIVLPSTKSLEFYKFKEK